MKLLILTALSSLFFSFAQAYEPLENPHVEWSEIEYMSWQDEKTDGNSPLVWINNELHLFYNYWSTPDKRAYSLVAKGSDLSSFQERTFIEIGSDPLVTHRWFESVIKTDHNVLFAFYHSEEASPCSFYIKAPQIGVARSEDQGKTWQNLGFIIEAPMSENNCEAKNGFFSNGTGDFSVLVDQEKEYIYIYFSNYPMRLQLGDQGIAVARLPYRDLNNPSGKAMRWFEGSFSEPGLGGRSTPFFKTKRDFTHADADSLWGPAISYNTFLKKYVMLLARTQGGNPPDWVWPTEGIYMSVSEDLTNPLAWSEPVQILKHGHWYPQFVGTDSSKQETDSLMGERARFFVEGHSRLQVRFKKTR